jgi:hypothetical protein
VFGHDRQAPWTQFQNRPKRPNWASALSAAAYQTANDRGLMLSEQATPGPASTKFGYSS